MNRVPTELDNEIENNEMSTSVSWCLMNRWQQWVLHDKYAIVTKKLQAKHKPRNKMNMRKLTKKKNRQTVCV